MRGDQTRQERMVVGITANALVPADHPLRQLQPIVARARAARSPTFQALYAPDGRKSFPPAHLRKASLLIALYSLRSARQFCQRLHYAPLVKWLLDLNIADRAFAAATFAKNRQRLLDHEVAAAWTCCPPSPSRSMAPCWRAGRP